MRSEQPQTLHTFFCICFISTLHLTSRFLPGTLYFGIDKSETVSLWQLLVPVYFKVPYEPETTLYLFWMFYLFLWPYICQYSWVLQVSLCHIVKCCTKSFQNPSCMTKVLDTDTWIVGTGAHTILCTPPSLKQMSTTRQKYLNWMHVLYLKTGKVWKSRIPKGDIKGQGHKVVTSDGIRMCLTTGIHAPNINTMYCTVCRSKFTAMLVWGQMYRKINWQA